jgi:hypothetical protein
MLQKILALFAAILVDKLVGKLASIYAQMRGKELLEKESTAKTKEVTDAIKAAETPEQLDEAAKKMLDNF